MARKPTRHKTSAHPMFVDPMGKQRDFAFGVLRATYGGRTNSIASYSEAKLKLCARSEVLLPADAHDALIAPAELWRSYESAALPGQRDLATCVTLYLPDIRTLHGGYEEVREFAREQFVVAHRLPTMVVLHAPGLAGSAHDPHAHLIIAARELHAWGWGRFSALCRDEAQREVHDAWVRHRARGDEQ